MIDESIRPAERIALLLQFGQPIQKVHVTNYHYIKVYSTIREWLKLPKKSICLQAFEVLFEV